MRVLITTICIMALAICSHLEGLRVHKLQTQVNQLKGQVDQLNENVAMLQMGQYYTDRLQSLMHPDLVSKYLDKLPMDYNGKCPDDGKKWIHREGDGACVRFSEAAYVPRIKTKEDKKPKAKLTNSEEFWQTHRDCIPDSDAVKFKDTYWRRTTRYKPGKDVILADACAIIYGYQTVLQLKNGSVTCDKLSFDFDREEHICMQR